MKMWSLRVIILLLFCYGEYTGGAEGPDCSRYCLDFSLTRRDKRWRVSGVGMTLSQCERRGGGGEIPSVHCGNQWKARSFILGSR